MRSDQEYRAGNARERSWQAYLEANTYLNQGLIRTGEIKTPYEQRSTMMPSVLAACGHPEQNIPAIHIAGTSGKGTTAMMIAEILRAAGIRTGLHISPYLQVSTEKIWIDGSYIPGQAYSDLVNDLRPVFEEFRPLDLPLHGMAGVITALEAFRRARVELMVFETGVGGRYDFTNFLETMLSVITKIGYDHQHTLGRTITAIARHKAGIIKPHTPVVALAGCGIRQIRAEARTQHAPLVLVRPSRTFGRVHSSLEGTVFDYHGEHWHLPAIKLSARGPFQVENASLAIATVELLARRGYQLGADHVRQGLLRGFLPGRIEIVQTQPTVVLDGAHNPDKMVNLIRYLELGPKQKKVILCGVLATKLKRTMIDQLLRVADVIITTEPEVYAKDPFPARELARILLKKAGNGQVILCEPSPRAALELALHTIRPDDLMVVTGSLYLVGNLRSHWYPDREVLLQRTSYPVRNTVNKSDNTPPNSLCNADICQQFEEGTSIKDRFGGSGN
ncbi:hypothetical protein JXQ70_15080 [bacterium]|nr:hypothetical protein [bacterium]